MNKYRKSIIIGAVIVVVFDTIASFASLTFKFPYENATIGSILIYCTIGYYVYRHYNLSKAILAAISVEIVDATLGWYISWVIGPGALPSEEANATVVLISIVIVLIFAVLCAIIGSGIARLIHGPKRA